MPITYLDLARRLVHPPGIMNQELLLYASYQEGKGWNNIIEALKEAHEKGYQKTKSLNIGLWDRMEAVVEELISRLECIFSIKEDAEKEVMEK